MTVKWRRSVEKKRGEGGRERKSSEVCKKVENDKVVLLIII